MRQSFHLIKRPAVTQVFDTTATGLHLLKENFYFSLFFNVKRKYIKTVALSGVHNTVAVLLYCLCIR